MSLIMKAVAPAVSALALVFMVGATNAEDAKSIAPKGPIAQEQQGAVECYLTGDLEAGLKKQFNMVVKEKGDHPDFRLQIYANDTGGWMLAGELKDTSKVQGATPDMKVSCLLDANTEGGGYPEEGKQKPWYQQFFQAISGPSI